MRHQRSSSAPIVPENDRTRVLSLCLAIDAPIARRDSSANCNFKPPEAKPGDQYGRAGKVYDASAISKAMPGPCDQR